MTLRFYRCRECGHKMRFLTFNDLCGACHGYKPLHQRLSSTVLALVIASLGLGTVALILIA